MLAAIFVSSGLDAVKHPSGRAKAAAPLLDKAIPVLGLPDDKELIVRANGVAMLVGGTLLASGKLPRLASAVLAASLVPTTLAVHSFWEKPFGADRSRDRNDFLKNLGLLGGVLLATVDTEGKPGLAWRARKLRSDAADRVASARESLPSPLGQ
ncbi:MAG: DoxX family protein [Dermatophilaceae bacterium]|nr:DoxX family protein [Actinomycetales bacterium]MBP8880038.1 DoxX family protein [Dermatophilaceae bacterium]MBP9917910.1 DoxX family protein [Dermatophilaceae bacterium]